MIVFTKVAFAILYLEELYTLLGRQPLKTLFQVGRLIMNYDVFICLNKQFMMCPPIHRLFDLIKQSVLELRACVSTIGKIKRHYHLSAEARQFNERTETCSMNFKT